MPLIKSGSKQAISTNIREMQNSGHPHDQAVAAALSTARRYGKAAGGSAQRAEDAFRHGAHPPLGDRIWGSDRIAPELGNIKTHPRLPGNEPETRGVAAFAGGGGEGGSSNANVADANSDGFITTLDANRASAESENPDISNMGLFSGNRHSWRDLLGETYRQTRNDPSFWASATGFPLAARGIEHIRERPGNPQGYGEVLSGAMPFAAGTRLAEPLFSTGLRTFGTLAMPQAMQDIGSGRAGEWYKGLTGEAAAAEKEKSLSPAQQELKDYQDQYDRAKQRLDDIMKQPMPKKQYQDLRGPELIRRRQQDQRDWDEQLKRQGAPYQHEMDMLTDPTNGPLTKAHGVVTEEGNSQRSFRVNHPLPTTLMQIGGEFIPMAFMARLGYTGRQNVSQLINRYDAGLAANTTEGAQAAAAAQNELITLTNPSRSKQFWNAAGEFGGSSLTSAFMNIMPDVLDLRSPNPKVKQEAWDRLTSKENAESLALLVAFGGIAGPFAGEKIGGAFAGPANWQRAESIARAPVPGGPLQPHQQNLPPPNPVPPPPAAREFGPREYPPEVRQAVREGLVGKDLPTTSALDVEGILARQNPPMRYPAGIQNSTIPSRLRALQQQARAAGKRKYSADEFQNMPGRSPQGKNILSLAPIIASGLSMGRDLSEREDQEQSERREPQKGPGQVPPEDIGAPHASGGRLETPATHGTALGATESSGSFHPPDTNPPPLQDGHVHAPEMRGSKVRHAQTGRLVKDYTRGGDQTSPEGNTAPGRSNTRSAAVDLANSYARGGMPKMPMPGRAVKGPMRGPAPHLVSPKAVGVSGAPIQVGAVRGQTGGRDDLKDVDVPGGSYIIPAETVSYLGGNNTEAGHAKLDSIFSQPKYRPFASGGITSGGGIGANPKGTVPIKISDGEYAIPPEVVARIGDGNLDQGHRILDQVVMQLRQRHIATLQKLPPPSK